MRIELSVSRYLEDEKAVRIWVLHGEQQELRMMQAMCQGLLAQGFEARLETVQVVRQRV